MLIVPSKNTMLGLVLMLVALVSVLFLAIFPPLPFLYSSIVIIMLLGLVISRYDLVSIPTFVIGAAFIPSLAFFWAWLNDAKYINYHNHWLQDNAYIVDTSVHLTMISLCFAIAGLLIANPRFSQIRFINSSLLIGNHTYVFVCAISAFFFWLTEPSLNTIVSSAYADVLSDRIDGTQYAGSLAVIFWLMAFITYSAKSSLLASRANGDGRWLAWPFLIVTAFAIFWLAIHARRNELIGMGVVWLLFANEIKGKRHALMLALLLGLILYIIGEVRTASLKYFVSEGMGFSLRQEENIVSMPGGASNIFMTYLDVIHYFQSHPFLWGETFYNYSKQLLPTNFYSFFEIETEVYFSEQVLSLYSYNGGQYIGAVFCANFGVAGVLFFGIFVGLYVLLVASALSSRYASYRLIGLFMLVMLFRAFWYELITVIKPICLVLLPVHLWVMILKKRHSARKIPNAS